MLLFPLVFCTGDAKSEDTPNKEAGEEKPEEDNDYHRSDEQVSPHSLMDINLFSSFPLWKGLFKQKVFFHFPLVTMKIVLMIIPSHGDIVSGKWTF